jgi:hypothetical protein
MDEACPEACGGDSRFDVVRCRVAALAVRTDALTDMEPFASEAEAVLAEAETAAAVAEVACELGDRPEARRGLKLLGKRSAKYGKRLRGNAARQAIIDAVVRSGLATDAKTIRAIAKNLRRAVICAPTP